MIAITVRDATEADSDFCYQSKALAHRDNVIATYGRWDEEFQRRYHANQWRPEGVRIVGVGNVEVGWFAITEHSDHVAVDGVYVIPAHQGQGIGAQMMGYIHAIGQDTGKPVTLFVMKKNVALRFYEKLGYLVSGETETHWTMERTA